MSKQGIEWEAVFAYLVDCGKIQNPTDFSIQVVKNIHKLIPYDQARIYFVNNNGVIYDEFLLGVDRKWVRIYAEYYSQIENKRYSIFAHSEEHGPIGVYDWTKAEHDEFYYDYIKPQGIKYSIGFGLHDAYGTLKRVCMFDRIERGMFTDEEIATVDIGWAHLDNLHRNLYVHLKDKMRLREDEDPKVILTAREREISRLLSEGATPEKISKKLYLSKSTVYKHIAHIHEKLKVHNRQELLVRLLQQESDGSMLDLEPDMKEEVHL